MITGRVRFTKDIPVSNVDPGDSRVYRAGEEKEMILRGRTGQRLSEGTWWSSTCVDSAFVVDADDVEVIELRGPYWTKCGHCGSGGQIEEGSDGLPYVDTSGELARAREQRTAGRTGG
jgi:hypothetical protein